MRKPGQIPDDMEEVPAGGWPVFLPGLDHMETEPIAAFLMDRHPVTNRDFKRFVDDGGYARAEFWREPFLLEDCTLPRGEAMARLVDAVGQPGPAGWEMGEYPAGEDDHPVSGVSWYEAAAFAAWAGKSLPTIFHWNLVNGRRRGETASAFLLYLGISERFGPAWLCLSKGTGPRPARLTPGCSTRRAPKSPVTSETFRSG